jgi:hypothetical protein
VISRQAPVIPKSHNGTVEALQALHTAHRSARKARTQALAQLHALVDGTPPRSVTSCGPCRTGSWWVSARATGPPVRT